VSRNRRFTIYKKTESDRDVWDLALERARFCFKNYDRCTVSFSGGKDSTAVLNVALTVAREMNKLPLHVYFFDDEAIPPDTVEYVERVRAMPEIAMKWLCLPVKQINACSPHSPYWYPWAEEAEHLWVRPRPEGALWMKDYPTFVREPIADNLGILYPEWTDAGLTVMHLIGLRAAESARRYALVSRRKELGWISNTIWRGVYKGQPIYDWSDEDVWTAPLKLGWDHNPAYARMVQFGVPRRHQRVTPPFGEQPLRNLPMFAECWPDLWEKMCHRVPGARTAGRYAESPVYGARGLPGWDEDGKTDPMVLIRAALMKWPEEIRPKIRKEIQRLISYHYRRAPDYPLPRKRPTPSGVTWRLLYKIAMMGDFKGRLAGMMTVDHDAFIKQAEEYEQAEEADAGPEAVG
jgi:predicted phosphoadenosine phosphosulfate sulfurtransferase